MEYNWCFLKCKFFLSAGIFKKFFSTSIRSIPTVSVLLNLGESPVVSVSITSLFILLKKCEGFLMIVVVLLDRFAIGAYVLIGKLC